MTDSQLLFAILCLSPLVYWLIALFWQMLKRTRREGTDRYNPRYGVPETDKKPPVPFKKSPDMLKPPDDKTNLLT